MTYPNIQNGDLTTGLSYYTTADYDERYLAAKITTSGNYTYIAHALPGSVQSDAVWRCKRVYDDGAGNITILWADGNSSFDNIATDLTALVYS